MRRNKQSKLSLEIIHEQLPSTSDTINDIEKLLDEEVGKKNECVDSDIRDEAKDGRVMLKAKSSSTESCLFHDLLHEYFIFQRPQNEDDLSKLILLVSKLALLCGESTDDWKFFVLVIFHRRYHSRSPTYKELNKIIQLKTNLQENDVKHIDKSKSSNATATGDGERMIHYVTLLTLHRIYYLTGKVSSNIRNAIFSLLRIMFNIGGTRDINTMIEHFTFAHLVRLGLLSSSLKSPPEHMNPLLIPALHEVLSSREIDGNFDEFLSILLNKGSTMLQADLKMILESKNQNKNSNEESVFMSTLHVTIPHHERGNAHKSSWKRCFTNSIAEILLWDGVESVSSENRYSEAMTTFRKSLSDNYETQHACLLKMQTTIRKKRQILNQEARRIGFLLSSQYLIDREKVTFQQIKVGKAGDLELLQRLARKSNDSKIMKMLVMRNTDPAKVQKIESISSLIRGWEDLNKSIDDDQSIEALERQLQIMKVKATIEALSSNIDKSNMEDITSEFRPITVCHVGDSDATNQVCALLMASAFQKIMPCRLFSNNLQVDITNDEKILQEINKAIVENNERTVQDFVGIDVGDEVENIVLNKLGDSNDLLVVSNGNVELNEHVMKHLIAHDQTIRIHSPKSVEKSEKVEVQLNATISERLKTQPLTLSVVLDCTGSMGAEIDGCKVGAIQSIDVFRTLAPVHYVNFMGYWDRIVSKSDPDPQSSGFLDPRKKENLDQIKSFVDKKLECTGGGDIPEDIPAAFDKLLADMESVDDLKETVHLLFFIADAGYRENEEERMTTLLHKLRDLDVVIVACPVRGGAHENIFRRIQEVFPGQHINVPRVSKLASIAATTTESIRASVFETGNISHITASVGDTFDSLSQLATFKEDTKSLKKVEGVAAAIDDKDDDVFVPSTKFGVTNIDRMYLQVSKLPTVCHDTVNSLFEGRTLQELVAASLSSKILDNDDELSLVELTKLGYPSEIVELVRDIIGGHGRKRHKN